MIAAGVKDIREKDLSVRVQNGGIELVEQTADAWRQLCDESGDEEVFYRPEWAQAYLQTFNPRADVIVISVWAGPKLRGVLPLVRHRVTAYGFPIFKLSVPANVHSLRASLTVCAGEEHDAVLKALWQAARDLPRWDMIDVANVVEGNGLDRLCAQARTDGYPVARKRTSQSLYLPINASSPEKASGGQAPWLAGTRPKFRSHLRRARRQLEEQGLKEHGVNEQCREGNGILACRHFDVADPEALKKFYDA